MGNEEYTHGVSRKTHPNWVRPDETQKAILAGSVIGGLIAGAVFGRLVALGVFVLGGVLYAPILGKQKRPVYFVLQTFVSHILAKRKGGAIYTVDMKDTGLKFDENEGTIVPAKMRKHRFSTKLIAIPFYGQWLAFYRTRVGKEDFLVGALIGDGHPRAMTGTMAQRFMWDKVFVAAIKRGLNVTTEPVDYTQFVMCRPADPTEVERYASERWHTDFVDPEPGSAEARIKDEELAHQNIVYADGMQYKMGMFIRMKFPKAWKHKDLTKLTPDQVRSAPIIQVLETWQSNLAGGVTNLRLPSLYEMNELGYLLFNSENLNRFFVEQAEDRQSEESGAYQSIDDAKTLRRGPWPLSVVASNDKLVANQTMHSTLYVTGLESDEVPLGFLDDLFVGGSYPFIFSRFIQTLPYKRGMKRTRRRLKLTAGLRGMVGLGRSEEFDLEGQEREIDASLGHLGLFRSKSRSTLVRMHFTVSGPVDSDEHRLRVEMASSQLRNHGMDNEQYFWGPNQLPPLLSHFCIVDGEE